MFEYIKGTLTKTSPSTAIIDIQGLGYRLHIPLNNYGKLPQIGAQVLFYISTVIREDSHKFFGFLTQQERDLFENLIAISGIGPKTALALIGHMELCELQAAIAQSNVSLVCKIPGIGKKTAERLIIEMKDKVFIPLDTPDYDPPLQQPRVIADAISALIHLGYNKAQSQKAVQFALKHTSTEPELAQLITSALRHM
ncbi:MAG TPA: Holliday junction branch migration protein RuvA [Rhabdochlamydiaceae bacterium]|jgi:Holliday junction DNA helicase RuvA